MSPKIKNILIFVGIGGVLFGGYFFFMAGGEEATPNLVSSPASILPGAITPIATDGAPAVGGDFLALLLGVKNLKLDDKIFSDPAFQSLADSSIPLIQDGNEGRPNPFAPLGSDEVEAVEEEASLGIGTTDIESAVSTPPPASSTSSVSASEKEVIINAVLNRQKILASGNVAQIRAYMKNLATTPEQIKEVDDATNKEILEGAALLSAVSLTSAQMRAETTVWTVTATEAKIAAKNTSGTTTVSAYKIKGSWY